MKKEEKESSVWKFQDIKVRKNILTLPLFVFFFFELDLRLAWILFWVGLELSSDKDQKCVKRHVGILGEVLSKFPKNLCFCFSHNLTYERLIWMILVDDET